MVMKHWRKLLNETTYFKFWIEHMRFLFVAVF